MNHTTIKRLLESGHAFLKPEQILENLKPEIAVHIPEQAVHSIAGHVAHMAWWQHQLLQDIELGKRQRQSGDEFPSTVSLESWETVKTDFLGSLEQMKNLCDDPALLEKTYIHTAETIGEALLDFALHNAYHLGQIVLLRRLQGAWNPSE